MGVTYKLKDEVVHFIISQRQGNPLFSCRQLAESTFHKFGLRLSKSSVHDVLKESGIITPRGRKPKDKFQIPQEKKKQIQVSLSQVKLLPAPQEAELPLLEKLNSVPLVVTGKEEELVKKDAVEISSEYEGAGSIFSKAALWDLGIFTEEGIKETEWNYYLTYVKGIKVVLENNKEIFIDLPLPLERCVREAADGLVNNVRPLIISKVSDEELFKACMEGGIDSKIKNMSVVESNNHIIIEFTNIMDIKRQYIVENRLFVENKEKYPQERLKLIFFSQNSNINVDNINEILALRGFDSVSKDEFIVTLLIQDTYANKLMLQEAAERLNEMFIRDEGGRLLKVKINVSNID